MIESILKLVEMEARYPRVFAALRASGWTEARSVALPPESLSPGLASNDYTDAFLHSFNGLDLRHQETDSTGIPKTRKIHMGFDERIERLDLSISSAWICDLAGSTFVYPIFDTFSGVAFALEDGKTLFMNETFQGYAWTPEPFAMLDWMLFGLGRPGLAMQYLPKSERPPDFYDFD